MKARIGHTALTWNALKDASQLSQAIKDCAEIGYEGTETAGRVYDWWEKERPGELRRTLREHGVTMGCLFQSGNWTEKEAATQLLEDAKRWSEGVKSLGGDILMLVPGSRRDDPPYSLDEFRQMAETMNRVGRVAAANGAITAMHPHWGSVAEARLEIELLVSDLDPAYVGFAPDTGQIAKGGADPFPIMERWADRIRHVHMKDLSPEWAEMRKAGVPLRSPEGYAELGRGVLDFRPIIPILERAGFSGWLMVELDEAKRTPREAAKISRDYLEGVLGLQMGRQAQ